MEEIKVKYFSDDIEELCYVAGKSDWIDLSAAEEVSLRAGDFRLIPLGVAIALPEGYEAHLAPRSSTFKNFGILQTNSVGVVDYSYRGDNDQWRMPVYATRDVTIPKGARICQFRIVENQPALRFIRVESLGGPEGKGLDPESLRKYSKEIARAAKAGLQIAIVNGGGNIFRGLQGLEKGFDRVEGDRMGMLATVINSLALSQFIKDEGVHAEVFSATPMEPLVRYYNRDNAVKVLEEGGVALIAGGTGSPFFTTDSGAALRALEINADVVLKGTRVDGVYTADPEKDPTAVKYDELTFDEAMARHLKVLDQTAYALCSDGNMPIIVFDVNVEGNLLKLVNGGKVGTLVHR